MGLATAKLVSTRLSTDALFQSEISRRTVAVFDRATIQGVPFSTTKTEGKKMSRESVVLMQDNKKYWAGRVLFFLSHTPPGVDVTADSDAYIAHVQ